MIDSNKASRPRLIRPARPASKLPRRLDPARTQQPADPANLKEEMEPTALDMLRICLLMTKPKKPLCCSW